MVSMDDLVGYSCSSSLPEASSRGNNCSPTAIDLAKNSHNIMQVPVGIRGAYLISRVSGVEEGMSRKWAW